MNATFFSWDEIVHVNTNCGDHNISAQVFEVVADQSILRNTDCSCCCIGNLNVHVDVDGGCHGAVNSKWCRCSYSTTTAIIGT